MDITRVSLRPVAMNKVCAIASIVIDDACDCALSRLTRYLRSRSS